MKNSVVLIRQFRIATYVNDNTSGELIETCAGLLDNDTPEDCIRKEAVEETGYQVGKVEKLFEAYMSPGGVTELLHFSPLNTAMRSALTTAVAWKMKRSPYSSCRFLRRWRW